MGFDVPHKLKAILLTAAAVLVSAGLSQLAPRVANAEEAAPSAFSCRFDTGQTWTFEDGKFKSAAASLLSFDIEAVDLEKQSASLAVNGGHAGTLRIVRALNANSFLEVAQEGFLNLTTIYDRDAATGTYPAVHSRHFGLLGQPMFAQYAGTCTAK